MDLYIFMFMKEFFMMSACFRNMNNFDEILYSTPSMINTFEPNHTHIPVGDRDHIKVNKSILH